MPVLTSSSPHLRAVKAAYDAAHRAATAQDADSQLHALIEAVWWISAANEYLRKLHGAAYESARDGSESGRMVKGMWWVRSAAMHDPYGVTNLVEQTDAYTDVLTDMYGVYVWLPVHEIELWNDDHIEQGFGREEYAGELADGPPVIGTVREAIDWLHHLRTEDLPKV